MSWATISSHTCGWRLPTVARTARSSVAGISGWIQRILVVSHWHVFWLVTSSCSVNIHHPHSRDDFSTFFTGKVDTIRATTATSPAPMIEHRQVLSLASFSNVRRYPRSWGECRTSSVNLTRCQRGLSRNYVMCSHRSSHPWRTRLSHRACYQTNTSTRSFVQGSKTFFRPTWHQVIQTNL